METVSVQAGMGILEAVTVALDRGLDPFGSDCAQQAECSEKPPPSVPQFPHLKYMIEEWGDPTDRSLTSRRLGEAEAWIRDHPPTYTHTLGLWLAQPSREWLVERCDFCSRQSRAASSLSGHRSG